MARLPPQRCRCWMRCTTHQSSSRKAPSLRSSSASLSLLSPRPARPTRPRPASSCAKPVPKCWAPWVIRSLHKGFWRCAGYLPSSVPKAHQMFAVVRFPWLCAVCRTRAMWARWCGLPMLPARPRSWSPPALRIRSAPRQYGPQLDRISTYRWFRCVGQPRRLPLRVPKGCRSWPRMVMPICC